MVFVVLISQLYSIEFCFDFRFVQKQMGIWKTGYDDDRVANVASYPDKNFVWVESHAHGNDNEFAN